MIELLPMQATFAPGEQVAVEVRGGAPTVTLTYLGDPLAHAVVADDGVARFGPLEEGGYGVEADGVHSALDVLADPLTRPRYGFVSHYEPARDPAGVVENARRLHLNVVQFYDWMYRHAQLLPPSDTYNDALGQQLSLASVRRLAAALSNVGALPLGYAAVYAAGADEWPDWRDEGLYRDDGEPWMLADFLWIVDPSSERWIAHLGDELRQARKVGFAGFHLDQYGAPKEAVRLDGRVVALADAFPSLVDRLAETLPGARLVFNNVNAFPVWRTAGASVAFVYIEVWPPHERLGQLGALVTQAQALAGGKAVVLAAYLQPYATSDENGRAAERLLLATVFSHGATALIHGEEDAVLIDPYYVRHARQSRDSLETTRRWYDFAVRHGDLLFDRSAVDVTGSYLGGVNEELKIDAPVAVSVECAPGTLWARAVRGMHGMLVHLIDLSPQSDDRWNEAREPGRPLEGVRLHIERVARKRSVRFADPDSAPRLQPLETTLDDRYDVVAVPPFRTWALIWIRDDEVQE